MSRYRKERDTMGEILVPAERYWGAQTQRSFENFMIGGRRMPMEVIMAFAALKKAAARANCTIGVLDSRRAGLISRVCDEIAAGERDDDFPLVVYQTGSGTQTNMNVNEVIANRGNELAGERLLHPNDHVNRSQSSNDTFPSAMHIAALIAVRNRLVPAAEKLEASLEELEKRYASIPKTGRTHLQDATPLTLGQEISGWRSGITCSLRGVKESSEHLRELALGGTAVGTGLNAPAGFAEESAAEISRITGERFVTSENKFHSLTSKSELNAVHGSIRAMAADLLKTANDIRMLASGPRCGIGEISIPENEPGSSIMPGKVNPTQCEALTMVCAQIFGNDTTIGFAASQGNFQLNVYMPVMICDFLESVELISDGMISFEKNCVSGIKPRYDVIERNLENSLMLVTALNNHVGYERSAEIAGKAHREGISLREAAVKAGYVTEREFDEWVDPMKMTGAAER